MVLLRPLGNLSLAWGMKHSASLLSGSLHTGLLVVANPFVAGGVFLLVLTLLDPDRDPKYCRPEPCASVDSSRIRAVDSSRQIRSGRSCQPDAMAGNSSDLSRSFARNFRAARFYHLICFG